jgi:ATP sulfurylase
MISECRSSIPNASDQLRLSIHSKSGLAAERPPPDNGGALDDLEPKLPTAHSLVPPHGRGALKPLLLEGGARHAERARAKGLRQIRVSSREKGDLIMLAIGGFTPLDGFMTHADWKAVCDNLRDRGRASSGRSRSHCPSMRRPRPRFAPATTIALVDPDDGDVLAVMTVTEQYRIDKAHECRSVFRTTDSAHPGVKMVLEQGDVNLAGRCACSRPEGSTRSTARSS